MQKVVASLKKNGRVARGFLGVSTMEPQNGQSGALVAALEPRGPADRAGVKPGDVIVGFNGSKIDNPEDVAAATLELEPGTKVTLDVLRRGDRQDIQVTLGTRPPPQQLQRR